jgi:hypothetical protein
VIQSSRLRAKNMNQQRNEEARKRSQQELQEDKLKELQKRFERNEIQCATKKEKVKKMGLIEAYKNER